MKKSMLIPLLLTFSLIWPNITSAQTESVDPNVIKLHITPILLNNYGIQYERMLTPRISVALNGRLMPKGKVPLQGLLEPIMGDVFNLVNPDDLRVGGSAVSPEVRFYFGQHDGPRGFYLAPYVSFSNYKATLTDFAFSLMNEQGQNQTRYTDMEANINGITGGLLVGAQWKLGKMLYLDWWILGGSYGQANGNLDALTDYPLEPVWQEALRDEIENLDLPLLKIDAEVHDYGMKATLNGPWAGIKGGLSLGIRF